ncbi:hypothetical protein WN990_16050 [Kitasatospora purpeofusca]|uniref:hypothetical protein n=1 Tax=Kitasatospora purpeofusca TaxID=67352 RepID=UPI0030EFAC34
MDSVFGSAVTMITDALSPLAGGCTAAGLAFALRRAEADSAGWTRDLWGFAAAAAEAAGEDTTSRRARELWATAADYAQKACAVEAGRPVGARRGADEQAAAPVEPVVAAGTTVGAGRG